MSEQMKYNIHKGISTGITFITPIATAFFAGNFFDSPERSMSTTAWFAIIISAFFLKDKIAENFKSPTAFILATAIFVFCILAESIIHSLKIVAMVTMITCGVDELTFKHFYKQIDKKFEEDTKKTFGFVTYAVLKRNENKEDSNVNTQ